MSNKKRGWIALALAVFCVLSGYGAVFFLDLDFVTLVCAELFVVAFGLCIAFFVYFLKGRAGQKTALYKLIAVIMGIEFFLLAAIGVWDMMNGSGFLPGLLGALIHIFFLPVVLGVIIVDLLIGSWAAKRHKES